MADESTESLVRQLYDDKDRYLAVAVRKLWRFPDIILHEIPRFFELTLCNENTPSVSWSWNAINLIKSSAVPFLLEQTKSADAFRRQRAIDLLGTVGFWSGGSSHLATGELEPRSDLPPNWGDREEEVLMVLSDRLSDPNLSVRFAAALVLESLNHLLEQTIPVLIEALSSGTTHQSRWAALRLGGIGPPASSACHALFQLSICPTKPGDPWSEYARRAAQVALIKIGCNVIPQ